MLRSLYLYFIAALVLVISPECPGFPSVYSFEGREKNQPDVTLSSLSDQLMQRLSVYNYDENTYALYKRIVKRLRGETDADSVQISSAYYYTAVYNQSNRINNIDSAIILFNKSKTIRENINLKDEIYSKICTNLSLIYINLGDPMLSVRFGAEGLEVRQELNGKESEKNISPLLTLSGAYLSAYDFDKAIETALLGIKIISQVGDSSYNMNHVRFYLNAGNGYLKLKNYSIAEDYLKVALNFYNQYHLTDTELLLSILNALAVTNLSIDQIDRSIEYYQRAVLTIMDRNYFNANISITTFTNFGYLLGNEGDLKKGEYYIREAVNMALKSFGSESLEYQTELENYATFLADKKGDVKSSLRIYEGFEDFLEENPWNREFRNTVYYDFADALKLDKQYPEALEKIEVVLRDTITSDRSRLISLILKREVFHNMYNQDSSVYYLEEAFGAIREAVDIYDRIRNDISTDESLLKAGSRYNYIYENCISTLYSLYKATGDDAYSELSFTYAEKAKASSLLASTRQSRAMKFHIPEDLLNMELKLEKEIRTISELIYNEISQRSPDSVLIARYESIKLAAIMRNDSLRQVFEKDYPNYNALRSSTAVSGFRDVRKSVGRKHNFIEYYVADTILYIYLVNNSLFEMHAVPYTKELQQNIRSLRDIIVNPAVETGAMQQYLDYSALAHSVFNSVFSPVEKSLISDRLIIAPDGILSYIPFETLLTREVADSSMNYRNLPFLVRSFDIVYAYSGTLLSESAGSGRRFTNHALTFAPDYRGDIFVDSIMISRQNNGGVLENIPGAREEAISVNRILGGELFLDNESTESKFKERAPAGRIIHLAMHTLLNDANPMYSKMVFESNDDGPNDGKLNTYEIYDVPLRARMVVLSSCNTGSGYLQSGEGVMSLARGFFYSGSPTVVMSLWEVDDRSGSLIIKQFYENLKHGSSKSKALRRARENYLRDADQMRSHPYFWCTLVIMGDDSPLFYSRTRIMLLMLVVAGIIAWLVYRQRFRSS